MFGVIPSQFLTLLPLAHPYSDEKAILVIMKDSLCQAFLETIGEQERNCEDEREEKRWFQQGMNESTTPL